MANEDNITNELRRNNKGITSDVRRNSKDSSIVSAVEDERDGVEKEDLDPRDPILHPFDPQVIKIIPDSVNLGSIIENLENKEIDLSPAFQRKRDLWNDTLKSRLIESLILGLPLPTFFFANETVVDKDTGEEKLMLVVVDGLQRLCTIQEFVIDKSLRLTNLEFLSKTHTGKTYDKLSREEQRKIRGARITYSTILENNPPLVKFIVFRRINTGGLPLNPQEIRHALNQGAPAQLLKSLAESVEFTTATSNAIKTDRMLDCEFINRFIAFYILGFDESYGGDIEFFLAQALIALSEKNNEYIESIKFNFIESMNCTFLIFGEDAFRKPRTLLNPKRKALSKALFDCISVNIANLSPVQRKTLVHRKSKFLHDFNLLFDYNKEFVDSISNATGTQGHVKTRFEVIRKLIEEVLR